MVAGLALNRRKEIAYVFGYFILLIFAASGLFVQGEIFAFLEGIAFAGAIFGYFLYCKHNLKCLKKVSNENSAVLGRKVTIE